jgi:2,3-bisphosphoglycerate-dependent phosphoglycerate mutase
MSTIVYLIRHSKKDFIYHGDDFYRPLTLKGKEIADKLALLDEFKNISIIYSSPYLRTIDTVKPLAEKLKLDINIKDNLHEIIDNKFGSESFLDIRKRSMKALEEILEDGKNKTILICTHAIVIRAILSHYDQHYDKEEYQAMSSPDIWKLVFNDFNLIELKHLFFNFD